MIKLSWNLIYISDLHCLSLDFLSSGKQLKHKQVIFQVTLEYNIEFNTANAKMTQQDLTKI